MKKAALALAGVLLAGVAIAAPERGPEGAPTGREVSASARFPPGDWPTGAAITGDPAALARQARSAADWLEAHPGHPAASAGVLAELGVSPRRVVDTLRRLAQIVEEDATSGAPSRLADAAFLDGQFEVRQWAPDTAAAAGRNVSLGRDELRLTRYFVPEIPGAAARTADFPVALYADPGPELRERFTRKEVLDGVFEAGGAAAGAARALVWLSRADAHDAMMQGTVAVRLDTGTRTLNVHVPNGRPYHPGRSGDGQERLWYFREVDGAYGFGEGADKVRLEAGAAVAGDVYNLGVGALVGLRWATPAGERARLVIVADTGGAFQPNLFQLDYFAGSFPDRAALYRATAELPERVHAGVLLAR